MAELDRAQGRGGGQAEGPSRDLIPPSQGTGFQKALLRARARRGGLEDPPPDRPGRSLGSPLPLPGVQQTPPGVPTRVPGPRPHLSRPPPTPIFRADNRSGYWDGRLTRPGGSPRLSPHSQKGKLRPRGSGKGGSVDSASTPRFPANLPPRPQPRILVPRVRPPLRDPLTVRAPPASLQPPSPRRSETGSAAPLRGALGGRCGPADRRRRPGCPGARGRARPRPRPLPLARGPATYAPARPGPRPLGEEAGPRRAGFLKGAARLLLHHRRAAGRLPTPKSRLQHRSAPTFRGGRRSQPDRPATLEDSTSHSVNGGCFLSNTDRARKFASWMGKLQQRPPPHTDTDTAFPPPSLAAQNC
ncbi:translation initiation factor IF-2-like [Choloepus didactylus]|uniref:translation initiation factor IF-2-like n=1 Tax=Choloepus didactylus TaxID=27675 RepID=UPI00189D6739|nr:translation initiation factor IF-2-like [Choloepus didactylus]